MNYTMDVVPGPLGITITIRDETGAVVQKGEWRDHDIDSAKDHAMEVLAEEVGVEPSVTHSVFSLPGGGHRIAFEGSAV